MCVCVSVRSGELGEESRMLKNVNVGVGLEPAGAASGRDRGAAAKSDEIGVRRTQSAREQQLNGFFFFFFFLYNNFIAAVPAAGVT